MKKPTHFFTPYEWFLLLTIVTLNIIVALITHELKPLSITATISGVLCVVLVAKGHISNYLFGLIQVSLYAYVSWGVGYWGEVALNALYYVPMQFIGFFLWRKRTKEGSKTEVKARFLTTRQRILLAVGSLALTIAGGIVLKHYNDPAPYLDSATTFLSILAMLLMVQTYSEQWYLWIVVNLATITMWAMAFVKEGDTSHLIITSMWCVYLLNSIHGLFLWKKEAARQAA